MSAIELGRLLRASTTGCVLGCKITRVEAPSFGSMVRIPLGNDLFTYGLIYDMHIDDDGLVRQLVTAPSLRPEVIQDNRENRNLPVEISILFIGYEKEGDIFHLLPPRPPLTLDMIYGCSTAELSRFTSAGRFGYFRHILRQVDLPVPELLAAHLQQAHAAQSASGNPHWLRDATRELITLLRDDYSVLNAVLGAIADLNPSETRS